MNTISNNDLTEVTNCLYRVTDTIFETFSHIEQHISKELKDLILLEREKFVAEENKRNIQ